MIPSDASSKPLVQQFQPYARVLRRFHHGCLDVVGRGLYIFHTYYDLCCNQQTKPLWQPPGHYCKPLYKDGAIRT